MAIMQNFKHPQLGEIRVLEIDGAPWFVGKDIAAALGYSDTFGALKKHVDDEDKQNFQHNSFETPRGMTVINENGFYSLAFSSKLPNAKQVKNWIDHDVLPILREHNSPVKNDDNISESPVNMPDTDKKCAIQTFENSEFGKIRVIEKDGEPWFVAVDVCQALELSNVSVALARLDKDDRAKFNLGLTENSLNIVSEPGLYILILGSRKPEAKAFKRWITHEVLPSIRKTGMYVSTVSSPQYDVGALSSNLQMVKAFSETLNTLSGTVDALFKTMAQTEMEQKRQAEEQARQAAEQARQAAEQERMAQEQARQTAEQARQAEEQKRMAQEQTRQAQEQEQHTEALKTVDQKLEDIRDVVVTRPETWRKDCLHLVSAIAQKRGGDSKAYQDTNVEIFNLVDQRAHVSLQTRLTNRLNRMKAEGVGKSKRKKLNKIDIIAEDNKLIEIYIAIIKEMCVKYEVSPSVLEEAQSA